LDARKPPPGSPVASIFPRTSPGPAGVEAIGFVLSSVLTVGALADRVEPPVAARRHKVLTRP
jgi:hypothetical protein